MINIGKMSNTKSSKDVILQKENNGCIRCISHCTDNDGYVRIKYKGKHDRLFRVLYEKENGAIPKGNLLRHLCNNSWCVNVNHLEIGTSKDNYEDMVKCGRSKVGKNTPGMLGTNNPASKLNENDIKTIYLSDLKNSQLAKDYGVSKTTISYIKRKKQWKWLTDTLD